MKNIIGFLIILFIIIFTINSFAFQNEPDGFRGIKWGTKIETLKDMRKYSEKKYSIMYRRNNDKLQIGDVKLDNIYYIFWQGKLHAVLIVTKGLSNWSEIKGILFFKFGKGDQNNEYIEKYRWGNPSTGTTFILLNYNEFSKKGTLLMYSVEITNERQAFKKQKTKEGTKDF